MDCKTSIITVTYGNRAIYVEQLVEAAWKAGASEIFVLDNGSTPENTERLDCIADADARVFVYHNAKNEGSAGGYKKAFEWAGSQSSANFFWVLDDDNIPHPTALESLILAYKILGDCKSNVLVSYRKLLDREALVTTHKQKLLSSITAGDILGRERSLWKIGLKSVFKVASSDQSEVNYPIVRRARASWGGLFFHKEIFHDVGYPNDEFFLYGDDFEYSDRICNSGRKIFTVYGSQIVDIDPQPNASLLLSDSQSAFKTYYALRNHVYLDFEGKAFSCFCIFLLAILGVFFRRGLNRSSFSRFVLIYEAVSDGYKGRLGRSEKFYGEGN